MACTKRGRSVQDLSWAVCTKVGRLVQGMGLYKEGEVCTGEVLTPRAGRGVVPPLSPVRNFFSHIVFVLTLPFPVVILFFTLLPTEP